MGKVKKFSISLSPIQYDELEQEAVKYYDGNISATIAQILKSHFYRKKKAYQLDPHSKQLTSFVG